MIALVIFLISESGHTQKAVEETHETARRTEAVGERTAKTVSNIEAGQERLAAATEETAAASKETADAAKETAASARETAETTNEIADDVKDTKEAVKENSAKGKNFQLDIDLNHTGLGNIAPEINFYCVGLVSIRFIDNYLNLDYACPRRLDANPAQRENYHCLRSEHAS